MVVAQVVLTSTHIVTGTSILSFVIAVVLFIMKINKNRREMDALKLDKEVFLLHKTEFKEHCESNRRQFELLNDQQVMIQTRQNELLNKLVEQYTELKTDVKWLKQEWIKDKERD